jgi:transcriptional regulator with XRE-family HTH domain
LLLSSHRCRQQQQEDLMAVRIRPRTDQVRKYALVKGIHTDSALAAAMGVNRSVVSRALSFQSQPTLDFVAKLRGVFPQLGFDDLFEMIEEDDEVAAA